MVAFTAVLSQTAPTTFMVQWRKGENPRKINTGNACILCQSHQINPVSKAASGLHSSASVLINIFMEGNFSQGGICLIIIIYLEIA